MYDIFLKKINAIPKSLVRKSPGKVGLARTKFLLSLLDDPQEKISIIHIAGTSGKGSTACFLSHLLIAHGFKVGLHFKPHVFDIRERFQINNTLLSKEKTALYAEKVFKAVEKVEKTHFGSPTYFETLVALAYYVFFKERVDYAIVETGVGGLYDGTNTVTNPSKIAVITRLGTDHALILGKTKQEIAWQKAGIIHKGNTVVSIFQEPTQRKAIDEVARRAKTSVLYVKKGLHYKISDSKHTNCFSYKYGELKFDHVCLNVFGAFQVENAALALTVLYVLGKKNDFPLSQTAIVKTLKTVQIAGRYQKLTYKKIPIIFDGAHNAQKMKAFLSSLQSDYPTKKYTFIVAFKEGKDSKTMIKMLLAHAKMIIFTALDTGKQDMQDSAQLPDELVCYAKKINKDVALYAKREPYEALSFAKTQGDSIVVTGSLYLVSQILSHFFHQVDNSA